MTTSDGSRLTYDFLNNNRLTELMDGILYRITDMIHLLRIVLYYYSTKASFRPKIRHIITTTAPGLYPLVFIITILLHLSFT